MMEQSAGGQQEEEVRPQQKGNNETEGDKQEFYALRPRAGTHSREKLTEMLKGLKKPLDAKPSSDIQKAESEISETNNSQEYDLTSLMEDNEEEFLDTEVGPKIAQMEHILKVSRGVAVAVALLGLTLGFIVASPSLSARIYSVISGIAPLPLSYQPVPPAFHARPHVFGHNGGGSLVPENTLWAMRWAKEVGKAGGIEVDVQITKDGQLVAFHDEFLERTTGAQGKVIERTVVELKALNYTAGYCTEMAFKLQRIVDDRIQAQEEKAKKYPHSRRESPSFKTPEPLTPVEKLFDTFCDSDGQPKTLPHGLVQIPTLDEVVELVVLELDMLLIIEIKKGVGNEAVVAVNRTFEKYPQLYTRATVMSFFPHYLYKLRKLNPQISTVLLFSDRSLHAFCTRGAIEEKVQDVKVSTPNQPSKTFEKSQLCLFPKIIDWILWNGVNSGLLPYYLGSGGLAPLADTLTQKRLLHWQGLRTRERTKLWLYAWGQDYMQLNEEELFARIQLYAAGGVSFVPKDLPLPARATTVLLQRR
jgi:glycerophosphoryl diester phosphodiesterase